MNALQYSNDLEVSLAGLGLVQFQSFLDSFGSWFQSQTSEIDFEVALKEMQNQAVAAGVKPGEIDKLVKEAGTVALNHEATIANLGSIIKNSAVRVSAAFAAIYAVGVIGLIGIMLL